MKKDQFLEMVNDVVPEFFIFSQKKITTHGFESVFLFL
jgi:hypothetical protein